MNTYTTKPMAEASAEEIRDFAVSYLGIPVDGLSDSEVQAKVKAAAASDTIFVRGAKEETDQTGSPPPAPVKASGGSLMGGLGHDDPKVQITIHAEERDGVTISRHKEVGVNGIVWLLARGESITVPYRVYEALKNAERENITHDKDGEVIIQKVVSTPFNIEKFPSAAEIAAWEERTKDIFVP